ncbi:unnamed protein product, partial [Coccothraustes coccothraustes]
MLTELHSHGPQGEVSDPCSTLSKVESLFLPKVKNLDTSTMIREHISLLCNLSSKFD